MSRTRGMVIGVGAAVGGAALVALSLFLLTVVDEEAKNLFGAFLTLTVGLIVLGLAATIVMGLRYGKTHRGREMLAVCWIVLTALGAVITLTGVVVGEWPWIAAAVMPLLLFAALMRDVRRIRRMDEPPPHQQTRPTP